MQVTGFWEVLGSRSPFLLQKPAWLWSLWSIAIVALIIARICRRRQIRNAAPPTTDPNAGSTRAENAVSEYSHRGGLAPFIAVVTAFLVGTVPLVLVKLCPQLLLALLGVEGLFDLSPPEVTLIIDSLFSLQWLFSVGFGTILAGTIPICFIEDFLLGILRR